MRRWVGKQPVVTSDKAAAAEAAAAYMPTASEQVASVESETGDAFIFVVVLFSGPTLRTHIVFDFPE